MYDVITIGTATRDVFLSSPDFKVVRDPVHLEKLGFLNGEATCLAFGGKLEVDTPVLTVGGGAANAATTFARQGFRVASVVKVGEDENGAAVLDHMKKENITPLPLFDAKAMTAFSVILLSPEGERTIMHYRGASQDMTKHEVPWDKLKSRWVYIVPGNIPTSVMSDMMSHFKANKVMVAMNLSRHYIELGEKKLKSILQNLAVVIMNREEAAEMTGLHYNQEAKIFKKFDEMVPGLCVMTDGAAGVLVSDGHKLFKAGVFPDKKVLDRTGAGDAFGSGFVAGLIRRTPVHDIERMDWKDDDIKYAIRLGSANATATVEEIGAQEGLLTKSQFEGGKRWKSFAITSTSL